jgi:hypothetical protein
VPSSSSAKLIGAVIGAPKRERVSGRARWFPSASVLVVGECWGGAAPGRRVSREAAIMQSLGLYRARSGVCGAGGGGDELRSAVVLHYVTGPDRRPSSTPRPLWGALEGQRICVRWHRWVPGLESGSHRSLACCRSYPSRRAMHRSKAPALEHEGCYGERRTPSRVGLDGGVEHPGWSPVCQRLGVPI